MAKKKTTKKAAKKTATRSPARKATAKKHTLSEMDKKTIALVERTALMVQRKIKASSLPGTQIPGALPGQRDLRQEGRLL